jgi:hypothetical protein
MLVCVSVGNPQTGWVEYVCVCVFPLKENGHRHCLQISSSSVVAALSVSQVEHSCHTEMQVLTGDQEKSAFAHPRAPALSYPSDTSSLLLSFLVPSLFLFKGTV